jgi:predicted outer membrane repeat protein
LPFYTAEVGNENTQNLAKVFFIGNYSATRGSGIGSNRDVTTGRKDGPLPETECIVKKVWDYYYDEKGIRPESIEIELWCKIAGSITIRLLKMLLKLIIDGYR